MRQAAIRRIPRCIQGVVSLLVLFAVVVPAVADVPPDTHFQGLLVDAAGDPLTGTVAIEIGVFDAFSAGNRLYREVHIGVALAEGRFSLLLGTGDFSEGTYDASLFSEQNRFLEVSVDGETLSPRQPFSSVAYAFQAQEAQTAQQADQAQQSVTADDASTLGGQLPSDFDQSSHVSNTQNPHSVSLDELGGQLGPGQLAPGSVGTLELGSRVVTTDKIIEFAIDGLRIAGNAVTAAKIAEGAVGTSEIADNSITNLDIGTGAVGVTELAQNVVNASHLAANSVGSSEISAGAVQSSELASSSVGTAELIDGSIKDADISSGASISGSKLANNSVGSEKISGAGGSNLPIAYGVINNDGSLRSATTNVTHISGGKGFARVRVDGESPDLDWVIHVTPSKTGLFCTGGTATVISVGRVLALSCKDILGNNVETVFSFAAWKL